MEHFNKNLFVGVCIGVACMLIAIVLAGDFTIVNVFIDVVLALLTSVVIAALISAYRLYMRVWVWIYRAAMRWLVTRALNSALSQAKKTRIECSGIFDMQGTVALKILAGSSQGIQPDDKLNLYEATGDECWGSVVAVNVRESDCDCRPHDRANVDFWEHLEDRMKYDTRKPPNVYLALALDTEDYANAIKLIIALLRYWR